MGKARRPFTAEFKLAAIRLITDPRLSLAAAARRLGIPDNLLRKWKHDHEQKGDPAFPGNGNLPPEQEERRRLRAENKRLLTECEILKKAMASFARETIGPSRSSATVRRTGPSRRGA
jgi:transposase